MRPSATDSGALAPGPDCWGVWVGLGGRLGMGNSGPGGGAQRERRRGPIAPTLRVWRTCRLEGVPETCSGDSQRSVDYLVDARGFLSLFGRLAPGWALGGHPETSAHPGVEGTRFRATRPLRARDGLARKRYSRVGPGPRAMVRPSLRCIQGWRLPASHYAVGTRYSDGELAGIRSELWGRRCHFTRIRRLRFFPLPLVLTAWSRWSSGLESVGDSQLWPALRFPDRAPATAPPFLAINGPVPGGAGRRAPPGCQRLPDTGQLPAVGVELAVDLVRPGASVVNGT